MTPEQFGGVLRSSGMAADFGASHLALNTLGWMTVWFLETT